MGRPTMRFRFETAADRGYAPVLGNSSLVDGSIATQTAGSSNPGIYYRVGGGGLNGVFAGQLSEAGQLDAVNAHLRDRYDTRFGEGAFDRAEREPPRSPPLTSFLVPILPGVAPIGSQVVGLLYSVGPILGEDGIADPDTYSAIYADGFAELARARAAGFDLVGVRITMLSTGIYATSVRNPDRLFGDAASAIVAAALAVAGDDRGFAEITVLINTDDRSGESNERRAFAHAMTTVDHDLTEHDGGFDVHL